MLTDLVQDIGGALDALNALADDIAETEQETLEDVSQPWSVRLLDWQQRVAAQQQALLIPWHYLPQVPYDAALRKQAAAQVTAVWQAVGGIEADVVGAPQHDLPQRIRHRVTGWAGILDKVEHDLLAAIGRLGNTGRRRRCALRRFRWWRVLTRMARARKSR